MDEGTSKPSGGGGYRYTTDEERQLLERQKKVIWSWLKKVGRNLISEGVNLTKVSLPVELFESKSFLERVCDSWSYLDHYHRQPLDHYYYHCDYHYDGGWKQVARDGRERKC